MGEYGYMYSFDENKSIHAEKFADTLEDVMDDYASLKIRRKILTTHKNMRIIIIVGSKAYKAMTNFLDNLKYEIEHAKSLKKKPDDAQRSVKTITDQRKNVLVISLKNNVKYYDNV